MSEWLSNLERLSALFTLPSEKEEQESFLWQITKELFDTSGFYDQDDAEFFGGILEELAYSLERQVREGLARRIAEEERAPRQLVLRLSHDEISVSQPLLQHSPVLTEDDLVEISSTRSQDHLLAISQRMEVGIRLSSILVTRGNDHVVHHLAKNPNANMSRETIDRVADRSKSCQQIQAALIDRKDVPREVLVDLLDHVSAKVKKDLINKLDENYLDETVASMKLNICEGEKSRAGLHIEELHERHALNEQAILRFISNDEPVEFLLGLARLFSVDVKTARQIVDDKTGRALLFSCRSNKFSPEAFKKIASSSFTAMSSDPIVVLPLVKMYSQVSEENAIHALRLIGWHMPDANKLSAISA